MFRSQLPLAPARLVRRWCVFALTGAALLLTACAPQPDGNVADQTPAPTATSLETEVPTAPAAPTLMPEGTAEENLPFFTAITAQVWASEQNVSSRAYIDALTAAGFARDAMQVTDDTTTVDNPAESIQFSVRWTDGKCLIGQVGPSTGEPVTAVMNQVVDGRCLIGTTMPIDW